MAFCRLVFPLLVLSVVQSYASVQVPVFLWGDLAKTSLKSNPLVKTSVEEFDGVLNKELAAQPFTVIFIEETLSVEDFSRKNVEGSSSYPYLHSNIDDSVYMPSVENPLRVLNKLADPEKVDHVKLTENGLSAEIEPESGKFLFINLKDAREGESREELLRRHNDFMEDMFTKLQERYDKVVAIYTAHYPSWTISHSRVRRQAVTQNTSDWVLEGLRMYTKTILLNGVDIKIGNLVQSSSSLGNYDMNATLSLTDYNLELHFLSRGGYWLFNTITLTQNSTSTNENLQAVEELYAPLGFSYRCGQNVTFTTFNETKQFTLIFQNLKIQPYFNSTLNITDLQFGDSYNCVGFFSIPIWAGLFVVFILLSITFYGIMMMMDIRTMDRFDDPKGKTITINTVE